MARVFAPAHGVPDRSPLPFVQADMLRSAIVTGCALALILARVALPL